MSKREKTHLDEFIEWQRYRHVPGHYLGGDLTPFHKGKGNPKLGVIFWYGQAVICSVIFFACIFALNLNNLDYSDLFAPLFLLFYIAISISIGMRFTKKSKARRKKK